MPIPSKWVDTIKNVHEKHKPDYAPEFKSRLVSCGNFEGAEGVRTDAPTSDIETHALVAVFAACHGVPLYSSDIKNAFYRCSTVLGGYSCRIFKLLLASDNCFRNDAMSM